MSSRLVASRTAWTHGRHQIILVIRSVPPGIKDFCKRCLYSSTIFYILLLRSQTLSQKYVYIQEYVSLSFKFAKVHHIDQVGQDSGVVYCEMQGRENTPADLMEVSTLVDYMNTSVNDLNGY